MEVIFRLYICANVENWFQRALGDEGVDPLSVRHNYTQAFADEIIGDFVYLLLVANVNAGFFSVRIDRFIQWIAQSGLIMGIEIGVTQNSYRCLSLNIHCAIESDNTFGERASLVGAEHIHAAKILNGVQASHDHAALRHFLRAM